MNFPLDARVGLSPLDRFVIGLGLSTVCVLAWMFMAWQASSMADMGAMTGMQSTSPWRIADFGMVYLMWVVMMIAMMVPAASPMITAFATINRRRRDAGDAHVGTSVFLFGYLVAWSLFSVAATALHWVFESLGWLTPMMESASPMLSAVLFAAAGLYQWTPLKDVCLNRCRTPMGFVLTEWRDGTLGAVVMGLRHGLFCVGCCAALMGLLFAVAVMDLRWVAAVAVLVTIEKLLPWPRIWRHLIGIGLLLTALCFVTGLL